MSKTHTETIKMEVPDGWKAVGFRQAEPNEYYVDLAGAVVKCKNKATTGRYIIVQSVKTENEFFVEGERFYATVDQSKLLLDCPSEWGLIDRHKEFDGNCTRCWKEAIRRHNERTATESNDG